MSESLSEWQKLQQSAERARLVGDQEQAVVLYKQALDQPDIPWQAYSAMALACADSQEMIIETAAMDELLSRLAEQALQRNDSATRAERPPDWPKP